MLQFTKDDIMYVIELGVMMLLGLVVLFMVVRPLVKKILASGGAGRAHQRRHRAAGRHRERPAPRRARPA